MTQLTRIHEIIRHNGRERDEWYLVRHPTGRRYVLLETSAMEAIPGRFKPELTRKISVQAILAQNNELSQKLRSILEP
ncbi:hypothetical protein [Roseovarius sp. D0-M9]|uniref:hypothetical protein n=1 Tax=Roseovarius sp. D0-M9 TaxID=3127117 RepID=UPI00300F8C0E